MDFKNSVWFRRGWTLQELIAPPDVQFYDGGWTHLGDKGSLLSMLVDATHIDPDVLKGARPDTCSIAQRMSWAADRDTERVEDRAYSLVGLFGITLGANYGEREESFVRLQKEIMKESDDQTIFAWEGDYSTERHGGLCGLLARSPSAFRGCQTFVRSAPSGLNPNGYAIGQVGLSICLNTTFWSFHTVLALLDCQPEGDELRRYCILLEQLRTDGQYGRVHENGCGRFTAPSRDFYTETPVLVRQNIRDPRQIVLLHGFHFRHFDLPGYTGDSEDQLQMMEFWSRDSSLSDIRPREPGYVYVPSGSRGTAGVICTDPERSLQKWYAIVWIKVGFDMKLQPVIMMGNEQSRSHHSPKGLLHSSERMFDSSWIQSQDPAPLVHKRSYYDNSIFILYCSNPPDDRHCIAKWNGAFTLRPNSSGTIDNLILALDLHVRAQVEQCESSHLSKGIDKSDIPYIWTVDITRIPGQKHPDVTLEEAKHFHRIEEAERIVEAEKRAEEARRRVGEARWTVEKARMRGGKRRKRDRESTRRKGIRSLLCL